MNRVHYLDSVNFNDCCEIVFISGNTHLFHIMRVDYWGEGTYWDERYKTVSVPGR